MDLPQRPTHHTPPGQEADSGLPPEEAHAHVPPDLELSDRGTPEKDLFIPLKTEHYRDFEKRVKFEEFRPYGARWNERTCRVGRRVTLSLGYGKKHRMKGTITGFRIVEDPTTLPGWKDCYGERKCKGCATRITVDA